MRSATLTAAATVQPVIPRVTSAVVLECPGTLAVRALELQAPGPGDVVVEVRWSGISTGTERLLYRGTMPTFPGLAYPLVPGYESVGEIVWCGEQSGRKHGETVFVPGARCYRNAEGLFGGASRYLVTDAARVVPVAAELGERGVLLALAATAQHALSCLSGNDLLVVGHGVLGRLLARLAAGRGAGGEHAEPTVWEVNPQRHGGALGYGVVLPEQDDRRDYPAIVDVSGDSSLLNELIGRLAPGGQIVLAGFYDTPLSFDFAPAFMREATLRIAAQWQPDDLEAVAKRVADGALSLDGLISHRAAVQQAARAYEQAFDDPACLKMILDWRQP